ETAFLDKDPLSFSSTYATMRVQESFEGSSKKKSWFSLADALAMSSAWFGAACLPFSRLQHLVPHMRVPSFVGPNPQAESFAFLDGGCFDNLGILPLLQRKVQNILVLCNTM